MRVLIMFVCLTTLAFAQSDLVPAAQEAMEKAKSAMETAVTTYERQYPDLPLWKEAIAQAKEAIRVAPGAAEPLRLLAEIYSRSNWYGPAYNAWMDYLDTGAQLGSDDVPLFVEAGSKLAYAAYQQNQLEPALEYYLKQIDVVPYNKDAYVWVGRILLEQGKPTQAIPYWQTVVERDVTDTRAQYFLKLAKAQSQWGIKAATAFEEGVSFYDQADLPAARERFARAVGFNEMYSEAWAWLGRVEFEQGNYADASTYYSEASKLEPQNETYSYFYKEAERLKNQ
ncbi:MAG: tetratricopeptide repeat protein [Trueperaceae bacterium]|nr:tetratricopeptide repeat protein [Trueperaceae bacterium]